MTVKKSATQTYSAMRYIGDGAFCIGVPARDLTADEWAALTPDQREQAASLYEPVVTNEGE